MPKRIDVKGVIIPSDYQWVYDWLEWEGTSPKKIDKAIEEANGEPLEVVINSGGGDVYAGSEIYTALKEYSGEVIVKIVGIAASAASVIAMAGKKVIISPTAQIMIHNVSSGVWGDHRAHQHEAGVLENFNKSIANAYILKTGMSQEELLELMNHETWFNAQQALENKFADEIMFEDSQQPRLVASAATAQLLPPEVIAKIKNELMSKKTEQPPNTTEHPTVTQRTQSAPLSLFARQLSINERKLKL